MCGKVCPMEPSVACNKSVPHTDSHHLFDHKTCLYFMQWEDRNPDVVLAWESMAGQYPGNGTAGTWTHYKKMPLSGDWIEPSGRTWKRLTGTAPPAGIAMAGAKIAKSTILIDFEISAKKESPPLPEIGELDMLPDATWEETKRLPSWQDMNEMDRRKIRGQ